LLLLLLLAWLGRHLLLLTCLQVPHLLLLLLRVLILLMQFTWFWLTLLLLQHQLHQLVECHSPPLRTCAAS
jgi:hypothetical protein